MLTATITTLVRRTTTIVVSQGAVLVHQTTAIFQQVRLRSTTSRPVKAPPKRRRRRRALIITALLVAAGATAGGLLLFNKRSPSPPPDVLAAVSPDGKYIASADSGEQSIYIWNAATRRLTATLSLADYTVSDFSFGPDSKTLVVEPGYGPITIWNIATRRAVKTIGTGSGDNGCFALSPDGKSVAVCDDNGKVNLIDIANGHIAKLALLSASSVHLGGTLDDITFSPNGKTLAVAVEDAISCPQVVPTHSCTHYSVQLWDVRTRRITAKLAGGVSPLAYSHDGSMLFVGDSYGVEDPLQYWGSHASYPEQDATVWQNPGSRGSTWKITDSTNYFFEYVKFSPDGKTLAAVYGYNLIVILKVRTNQEIARFPESHVETFEYTPDGRTLVVAADGHVDLWDLATGQVTATLSPPS